MRSKEYWARRASERMVDYQADAVKTANEIGRVYFAAQKYLEAEAAKVFRGFRNGFNLSEADARRCLENVPDENALKALRLAVLKMPDGEEKQAALAMLSSPAYQYRINRLDALNRNIAKTCGGLCGVELKADKAFLGETAKKAYLETVFDIQKGTGVSGAFDMIPDGTVDQILKRNWSGANYSERIWGNTRKMADELKSDLLVGVLTGKTEREMADVIAARYQTSQFNARRLVQTETTYVVGQAELQAFKEAGAEKYEFSALLDEATSAICRGLDGKKFPVSEARPGENYPPMHPFCRSVTVADLPSEEELDKRWGNSADELGLDLPFDEWVKHLQTAPDGKMRYVKDLSETLDKSAGSGIIESDEKLSELGKFKERMRLDNRVSNDYYQSVKDKFSHGADKAKAVFNKYVPIDSVADCEFVGTAYYNPNNKKIYMNYALDLKNERGACTTWFHEHGHMIDDMAGKISDNADFRKILDDDYLSYMKKYGKKHNIKTFDKVQAAIGQDLSTMREHSAVSDILNAVSKNNIRGVALHRPDYWKDDSDICAEAFAHMFEAQFDEKRYKQMQNYFPNALKKFEEMLGGLV